MQVMACVNIYCQLHSVLGNAKQTRVDLQIPTVPAVFRERLLSLRRNGGVATTLLSPSWMPWRPCIRVSASPTRRRGGPLRSSWVSQTSRCLRHLPALVVSWKPSGVLSMLWAAASSVLHVWATC